MNRLQGMQCPYQLVVTINYLWHWSGNPCLSRKISTVDLLVLTGLEQLLLENIIYFFTKQATLMRGQLYWACPSLSIPWFPALALGLTLWVIPKLTACQMLEWRFGSNVIWHVLILPSTGLNRPKGIILCRVKNPGVYFLSFPRILASQAVLI